MKVTAKAYTNIALIKYWGKRDETLNLPMNSSLSLTLDQFYTMTTVDFSEAYEADSFVLDGQTMTDEKLLPVRKFLNILRKEADSRLFGHVISENHVPISAGFASSASAYAALAAAGAKAIGLDYSMQELSRLARQGSGSASRSIYGGFVVWQKGERSDGLDSYSYPICQEQNQWPICFLAVEVSREIKTISSRVGMKRTVETSPFYLPWVNQVTEQMNQALAAIESRDFQQLGEVMEANALGMHGTMLGANPPFSYWNTGTIETMKRVTSLRQEGLIGYFTIDAGPNVKVLCQVADAQKMMNELQQLKEVQQVTLCQIGPGITYL